MLFRSIVSQDGTPVPGNYTFTPLQLAQSHQLLSSGFASDNQPIGAGQFSFSFGGFTDQAIDLASLNGGQGVSRGSIKITDRSGDHRLAIRADDRRRAGCNQWQ